MAPRSSRSTPRARAISSTRRARASRSSSTTFRCCWRAAMAEVTRRKLIAVTGAVGAGGLAAGAVLPRQSTVTAADNQELAFYGAHQPGISAPVQAQGWLTAFDLKPGTTIAQVRSLMREWTSIAATTMAGKTQPSDDAMAYGRGPGALTVTVGVG